MVTRGTIYSTSRSTVDLTYISKLALYLHSAFRNLAKPIIFSARCTAWPHLISDNRSIKLAQISLAQLLVVLKYMLKTTPYNDYALFAAAFKGDIGSQAFCTKERKLLASVNVEGNTNYLYLYM